MDDRWFGELAAKASLLPERIAEAVVFNERPQHNQVVQARLETWCQTVASGDWQQLERRLTRDGLDLNTVRDLLGEGRWADGQPLPPWTQTLQEVIQMAEAASLDFPTPGATAKDRCIDPTEPIPFEEVLLPFVRVARRRLKAQTEANYALLSETCQATLERNLLRILSEIGSRTLLFAFSVFQTLAQTDPGQPQPDNSPKKHYFAFVKSLFSGELHTLFQEYSLLARLLATQIDFWVEATEEFLQRLQADWPEIQRTFQVSGDDPSPLTQMRDLIPALSDPHQRGRFVIALAFASGLKLVYKPKDLGIDAAYQALLAWLNAQGLSPTLRPLKLLNRTTHGWIEFVAHQPCQNQAEARQFYQRGGMLLALLYTLHGIDYHHENMIACGPHPVPVDHEMLMYPFLQPGQKAGKVGIFSGAVAQRLAYQQASRSVLNTMLLPTWMISAGEPAHDISAWGAANQKGQTTRQLQWQHINTDQMARVYKSVTLEAARMPNIPILDGAALALKDYLADFLFGFRSMYRFLLARQEALLASGGPLAAFKGQTTRFIVRETKFYEKFLQTALAPKHLRDGADWSIQLDLLSQAWLPADAHLWPILQTEQAALAQMDIPLLLTRTDRRTLILGENEMLENCLAETGYQLATSRLAGLNEADLTRQLDLIQASLIKRDADHLHQSSVDSLKEVAPPDLDIVVPLTPKQMVKRAMEIAQVLQEKAIRTADEAIWVDLVYEHRGGYYRLRPLDHDLYGGACGPALFFSALSKISGEAHYHQLALATLHLLRQMLQAQTTRFSWEDWGAWAGFPALKNIGGGGGLGSVIYALVRISQFLHEPALIAQAQGLADLLTLKRIAEDHFFDVIDGVAGTILGLLALYQVSPQASILAKAVACGEHLSQTRTASASGYLSWSDQDGKLLTGFSHGAAGIAYALLRLYEVSGEVTFRETAQEAIAYERSVFNAEAGNWPDLRNSTIENPDFMISWCHGAPGIGLARLGGLPALDTDEIRTDIAVALETTLRHGPQGLDHLCCGTLGRAEFLLAASLQMSRPDFLETAKTWAAWVVGRAEQAGGYVVRSNPELNWAYSPGFFQGIAGIGYELLRLAYPHQLPSILLWE
jgi:type 2 lantibiotic biosynthesis protein LanM